MSDISGEMNAAGLRFGLVVSRFNDLFTRNLLEGAKDAVRQHGGSAGSIDTVWVPGSFEIPQALGKMAASGHYDALIGLGVVIEGATNHAELITSNVAAQCTALSAAHGIPVVDGVVGVRTMEQAMERCGGKHGNRGWQCALVAIEMARLLKKL
ncbi:MAG TPA: 6,7-dimethyl-8-ribityllumazine synthase [Kiritimatiellia bacterium]|nr:6,7-dimethyl-8-ribityllumazine synthase [Kiritimatiellia bacterium]HMO97962.1 6,7-dimethyl-8-ribityllumazine synthase [Kiritimatiellia bacterium]HMP95313.1 6,7-dimethyl-8-ribityllumazine synthase [Kiritimatiellia bacterium]